MADREAQSRERALRHSRAQVDSIRDIGPPPEIVDPDRRERCRYDLRTFLETYFPKVFFLGWSADHEMLLKETQSVVLDGGKVCVAMPRGSGKTSVFQGAMIWASIYGHQRFTIMLLADATNFKRLLNGIKTIMETNLLLLQDFPEVIYPIRKLERTATRANFQICCGQPTYIKWGTTGVQFAHTEWTVERGNASICMGGGGLTSSAIRGQVMALPNGDQLRPTLALVDDPQTRKVAKSETQCQELEDIIKADICGMAGPDSEMSLMMSCTVIHVGDLADRVLDQKRNPQIKSIRVATIKRWPDDMTLWEQYADIRRQAQVGEVDADTHHKFYKENRDAMDAGAVHYWPERVPKGWETAIENSMAEYFEDPRSFLSERQNAPAEELDSEFVPLNPLELARRISPFKRNEVPPDTDKITCFVDVQLRMLFYAIVAWNKDFGGVVLDYGTWPQMNRRHYLYSQIKSPTLQQKYAAEDDEAIKMGITDLLEHIGEMSWVIKDESTILRMDRGLVDCGFKYDVVEAALIHGNLHNNWMPARGIGLGAKDQPLKNFRGQRGINWVVRKPDGRFLRSVMVDSNYWKNQLYDSLIVPPSHPMAIRWYKQGQSHHQLISDHCCAEQPTRVEAKGRRVDEWELRPSKPDNHYWDCLVGNLVAGSMCGLKRKGQHVETPVRRKARSIKI